MTFRLRLVSALPAVAILLWLAPVSMASAQDAMELDLAFKNSLSRGPSPEVGEGERNEQGQRHKARDAQGLAADKRDVRRRRGQRR